MMRPPHAELAAPRLGRPQKTMSCPTTLNWVLVSSTLAHRRVVPELRGATTKRRRGPLLSGRRWLSAGVHRNHRLRSEFPRLPALRIARPALPRRSRARRALPGERLGSEAVHHAVRNRPAAFQLLL